jgi:uncharacterized membrane protein HdeD (DUF308 family)
MNCLRRGMELRFLCVASAAHFFIWRKRNMKKTKWLVLLASVLLIVTGTVMGTMAAITETTTVSYLSGDVNGDGVINNKDMTRLKKFLAGTAELG